MKIIHRFSPQPAKQIYLTLLFCCIASLSLGQVQFTGIEADFHKVHFLDSSTGFLVGIFNEDFTDLEGAIYRTADQGITWNLVYDGKDIPLSRVFNLGFLNENIGIASTRDSCILLTVDGGLTWGQRFFPGTRVGSTAIAIISDSIFYVANYAGELFKTTDQGSTWVMLQDFGAAVYLPVFKMYHFDEDHAIAVVHSLGLIETFDGWISYAAISGMDQVSSFGCENEGNCVALSYSGSAVNICHSADLFNEQECYTLPFSSLLPGSNIDIALQGSELILPADSLLMYSADLGMSWEIIADTDSAYTYFFSAQLLPDNVSIASGSNGIFFRNPFPLTVQEVPVTGPNVFPNPATQYLQLLHMDAFSNATITIIDLQGKIVHRERNPQTSAPIKIGHLINGYYTLIIADPAVAPVRLSFIKQ